MALEPNHIDDIFRHRLHDAEMPPPAFVWTNVQHELQRRKRRRFFLWLFALGMAGAGLWAMFARQTPPKPEVFAPQQGGENNKAYAAIAEHTGPSETQKPEPTNNAAAPQKIKTTDKKWLNKGSEWRPGNIEAATLAQRDIMAPAHSQNERDNSEEISRLDQHGQAPTAYPNLLPLANGTSKSLTFTRQNDLPRPKSFIRKKKDPKYCYDFAQNPNVWMLDAYVGPSFNRRTLESANTDSDAYAQMRRATEQKDWSYHAGLRGSLLLGRHFLLRTGLHYEQMTEVFEYADPDYVKYIVVIINQPGEPSIIDTVGVEYGENYVKTFNRYGLLDVPLEVGYEMRRGRFGLSANAGMSFNVLFWKRGTILSPGGQPTPFTPGKKGATEVFHPSAGWSASGSVQMFFHLKPTVRLFAEPYYRQVLKPLTLDNQPVEQRQRNWGVKIGMTKILD